MLNFGLMRVVITTGGSRGDVEPYVALGEALLARGHEPLLAAHGRYEGMARGRGLGFYEVAGDPDAGARKMIRGGENLAKILVRYGRWMGPQLAPQLRSFVEACESFEAEAVIYSQLGFMGFKAAEATGVPRVGSALSPLLCRTGLFPSVIVPGVLGPVLMSGMDGGGETGGLKAAANRASYVAAEQLFWRAVGGWATEAVREVLGPERGRLSYPPWGPFSELNRSREPYLHGWSEHVLPRPRDWGDHLRTTGYWHLGAEPGWTPPDRLADFLESGPAPVCVGFGSMANGEPERTTDTVLKALELAGMRGVLLTGWGGISDADLPDTVLKLEEAPHDWLFPRVAAVVHHGGAGTTAAALRAGVPSAVAPFFGDQGFWAGRVAALGAGPRPVGQRALVSDPSGRELARAISLASRDSGLRRGAREIGEKLRAEDGAARAAGDFEDLVVRPWTRRRTAPGPSSKPVRALAAGIGAFLR